MLPIVKRLTVTDYQGARVGIVVGSELRNGDGLPELQGGEPCLLIGREGSLEVPVICLAFALQGLARCQTQSRTTARLGCLRPQDQPRANTLPGAAYRTTLERVQDSFGAASCRAFLQT